MNELRIPRIEPEEAWKRMRSKNPPLLVCAYPEGKHRRFALEGSISRTALEEQEDGVRTDLEIIFYCN